MSAHPGSLPSIAHFSPTLGYNTGMIRPYRDADAGFLAPVHTAVFPDNPLSARALRSQMAALRSFGARIWVIGEPEPFGYAYTMPVPGLPHIVDLKGGIAPAQQRKGFGSRLLAGILSDLRLTAVRQVSHQLHDLDSAAGRFLQQNGFFIEHEEILLRRGDLGDLPPQPVREDLTAVTLPRAEAVDTFYHLFQSSFSGLPWDQPFSQQEIEASLHNAADILFLVLDSQPAGFSWLHLQEDGLGVIEPLGILPAFQNQGYGRFLLLSALHELARRGADSAQIGAWRANEAAIHLYESLGFAPQEMIIYLAYNLTP